MALAGIQVQVRSVSCNNFLDHGLGCTGYYVHGLVG